MAKGELKFKDAYCSAVKGLRTVDEIRDIYTNKPSVFMNYLHKQMLCPGCRSVSMTYVDADTPHLRARNSRGHQDDCPYGQFVIPRNRVGAYIQDAKNFQKIEKQLDRAVMSLFADKPPVSATDCAENTERKNRVSDQNFMPKTQVPSYIRQSRFDVMLHEDDFGEGNFKVFYGKALVMWEPGKYDGYKLLFRHPQKKYLMCKLFVSHKCYVKIPEDYKFGENEEMMCNCAFVANFIEPSKRGYETAKLPNSEFLRLRFAENT